MTAEEALRRVRQHYGRSFVLDGRCDGGEVGAFFAIAPDGRRLVLKWSDDPSELGHFARVVGTVDRLRARNYPAPRHFNPLAVDGGVVLFQEAVTGTWSDNVTHVLIDRLLELNDLQAGQDNDRGTWTTYIRRTLTEGADGFCIHESLERYNLATRRLLAWIRRTGDRVQALPGTDTVHLDFHHRNMLKVGPRLTSVVDWEGCRTGDRVFDLVTFCFGMTHATPEPGVEDRVWAQAVELGTNDTLRAYVAHMTLRRLDWTIRYRPEEMGRLIPFVENYVRRVV